MSDASSLSALESCYDELLILNIDLAEASREIEEINLLNQSRMVSDIDTWLNLDDDIDYVAEYVRWLLNLAEGDDGGGGRRGAPPAAKSAIAALETFKVGSPESTSMVCAVCKDAMVAGETGKKLPCGHSYHENCILPWLSTRNSCPLCRFQLQTDDPHYPV